jgi:hypothetical protein
MVEPRSLILKKPSMPPGLWRVRLVPDGSWLLMSAAFRGAPWATTPVPDEARLRYRADVELPPEPAQHEIGNRTYIVADVEPLDVDGVRTVQVGLAIWFLTFLALLPFWGALADADRTWWLWTCLAGSGLGLFGLEYCRRKRSARAAGHPHRH